MYTIENRSVPRRIKTRIQTAKTQETYLVNGKKQHGIFQISNLWVVAFKRATKKETLKSATTIVLADKIKVLKKQYRSL
jgi:hypothetical protein